MENIVVVGAGHAGCQLAFSLRENGFAGSVTLVNGEGAAPYQRPPLSKIYLKTGRGDDVLLCGSNALTKGRIELVSGVAQAIDRSRKFVQIGGAKSLPYDHLVLATGTLNRRLAVEGGGEGVLYLKSLRDADQLRMRLALAQDVVIVGAGFIGLEVAAFACAQGKRVRVVDVAARPMARVVSEDVSRYFKQRHEDAGVRFHLATGVAELVRCDDVVTAMRLANGDLIPADLVVAGLGVVPDIGLAQTAGLLVDNGVAVDANLSTSDPFISAIGDCARFPSPHAQLPVRLESVQNANDQARNVAMKLTGKVRPYVALPWFWSDQGPDKLQIAGLPGVADERVVRGLPAEHRFSVFSFRDGRLFCVESVNQPADHLAARRMLANPVKVSPHLVADAAVPLKSLVPA